MAVYAALVSLSHTLQHTLHPPPLNNIIIDREQIEFLQAKVDFFIDFLETSPSRGGDEIEDMHMRIADAAYEAEDTIESNVVKQVRKTGGENAISIGGVIEKFLSVERELMKMMREKQGAEVAESLQRGRSFARPNSPRPLPSDCSATMVGFDRYLIQIMTELATDESGRLVIPIVGMGGIGKTTLTTAVYNNPFIVEHFHIRAWVTISQEYTVRELLLRLVYQIYKAGPNEKKSSDDELGLLLHKGLFGRKYLIVMDDMWSIRAWEELKMYLPHNDNGSRILVTTRQSNLTEDFESCAPCKVDFLDEGQSWDLLRQKVFGGEDCPAELEEIGKSIVKRCNGLPLAIVVIGGLLAKIERRRELWESIGGDITSTRNYGNDEQLMSILSLSYIHLPIYLKPCFLYLAVFPEDSEIRVSMLVRLWVAEGLIKTTQAKSLEEVANDYLEDLFSRNLVLAHKRGSSGKVKRCKIHDLLRELCIVQAGKEKFVHIAKFDDPNMSTNMETSRHLHISSPSKPVETLAVEALQSAKFCRSWLSHDELCGSGWWIPEGSLGEDKVSEIIHGFDLLRVVHVNDRGVGIDLSKLSNLRCVLAPSVSSTSMSLCWNLQTLVVYELITLPAEVWQMPQLRHLTVSRFTLPDPPRDQNVIVLGNLQTLVTVRNFKCTEQVLERIPNLKKLRLLYSESSATSEQVGNYCLHNLASFKKLESLGIYCAGRSLRGITFPVSLKKLSLYYSMIPWKDLSIIGSLPNLEVLKLYTFATVGEEWNPIEGEFRRLKFLLIWGCRLDFWGADNDHFPHLERLLLAGVENLKEIPMSFAEIISLQEIELYRVCNSVLTSAREISEQRELLGYEPLQVRRYNGWEW